MVPPTTSRDLLYIETGLLDMESIINKDYANRATHKEIHSCQLTKRTYKGSWKSLTKYQMT